MVLLDQRSEGGVGAGIVDENVDAAELFQGQVDTAPGLVFVHRVRGHADRTAANVGCRLVGRLLLARGQHHVRAGSSERLRRGQPDSAGGAGDDRGLAV